MGLSFYRDTYGEDYDGNRGVMETFYDLTSDVSGRDIDADDAIMYGETIMTEDEFIDTLRPFNVLEKMEQEGLDKYSFDSFSGHHYDVYKDDDGDYKVDINDGKTEMKDLYLDSLDLRLTDDDDILDMDDDYDDFYDELKKDFDDYFESEKIDFECPSDLDKYE